MSIPFPHRRFRARAWRGLVDDAAIFPPGNAPLHDATAAYAGRTGAAVRRPGRPPSCCATPTCRWCRGFARDPLSVVVTGGAGQVAGPLGPARPRWAAPSPASRSRCATSTTSPATPAASSLPSTRPATRGPRTRTRASSRSRGPATDGWLAAADEVAAAELRLKLRHGGVERDLFPDSATVAAWIDAALDRETPFKCTAGLHHAVRHEPEGGGSPRLPQRAGRDRDAWDGGSVADATDALEQRDGAALGRQPTSANGPALVHLVRLLLGGRTPRRPDRPRPPLPDAAPPRPPEQP